MSEKPCLSRREHFFFSYVHLCGIVWKWTKSGDAHQVSCNIMHVSIRQTVHTCICPPVFAGFDCTKRPLCKTVVITCSHNKSLGHQTTAAAVEVTLLCVDWGLWVLLCQMLNYRVSKKKKKNEVQLPVPACSGSSDSGTQVKCYLPLNCCCY